MCTFARLRTGIIENLCVCVCVCVCVCLCVCVCTRVRACAGVDVLQKMPDSLLCNSSAAGPWPWLLVSPWQQLTKAQVNQMAAILDRPLMGDQDYSTLAALLGYTEEQVKFFSLQRPSPTEALLKDLHTRLPVNRITDRLLVAMGRMGAVWLSDFLRQACRVDRATALALNEDITSSVGDTLPRRAASGIYSKAPSPYILVLFFRTN